LIEVPLGDLRKLIEENAELRKEKMIRDMLHATSKHRENAVRVVDF
jgi:hypothetical protein